MKWFAYLDVEGKLVAKNYDYITTENPFFWRDNEHLILKRWQFDTDDLGSMRAMLINFKDLQLKMIDVTEFLQTIGFDLSRLKGNASTVQSR